MKKAMVKAKRKKFSQDEVGNIKLIRKANELVEARYKFDIWEIRMFAKTLSMIQPYDEDFKEYQISVGDMIQEFGLSKGGEIYDFLKMASLRLQDKKITIQRERGGLKTEFSAPLFIGVERVVDERAKESDKYIWVSFHPTLKPYLIELKTKYLVYDIRSMLSLKSANSIRIYELLKQYEKIGERVFKIEELKMILGIAPHEYALYGHFKDKVILKAQKDLEANEDGDITFEFEEIKEVRKVTKIKFFIKRRYPDREQLTEAKTDAVSDELKILIDLAGNNISQEMLGVWLKQYGLEAVEKGLKYTMNRLRLGEKINNVAAYTHKMIKTPGLFDQIEENKQKRRKSTEAKKQQVKIDQEKDQEIERNRALAHERKMAVLLSLASTEFVKQTLIDKVTAGVFGSYYKKDKSFEENAADSMIGGILLSIAEEIFPEEFAAL